MRISIRLIPALLVTAALALGAAACNAGEQAAAPAAEPAEAAAPALTTVTYKVDGMTCGGCEHSIKTAVSAVKGVSECSADHEAGTATVTFDPKGTNRDAVVAAMTGLGYKVTDGTVDAAGAESAK